MPSDAGNNITVRRNVKVAQDVLVERHYYLCAQCRAGLV